MTQPIIMSLLIFSRFFIQDCRYLDVEFEKQAKDIYTIATGNIKIGVCIRFKIKYSEGNSLRKILVAEMSAFEYVDEYRHW